MADRSPIAPKTCGVRMPRGKRTNSEKLSRFSPPRLASPPPPLLISYRPVETPGPARRLVADRHQSQCIGGMARPIMLRPEANVANVVLTLVVEPDRVPSGFGGRF